MCKDVECTFGILKGRWRILKVGVRVIGFAAVNKVWRTFCALHNMLLEDDGLDGVWEDGHVLESEWLGEMGHHDEEAIRDIMAQNPEMPREQALRYNASNVGAGSDRSMYGAQVVLPRNNDGEPNDEDDATNLEDMNPNQSYGPMQDDEGNYIVRNLSLNYFRSKLIEHFDIKFKRREVIWTQHSS